MLNTKNVRTATMPKAENVVIEMNRGAGRVSSTRVTYVESRGMTSSKSIRKYTIINQYFHFISLVKSRTYMLFS